MQNISLFWLLDVVRTLLNKYLLNKYPDVDGEKYFQARALSLLHIFLPILMATVLILGYADASMRVMIGGILITSLASLLFLSLGYLTTVTLTSYTMIGLFATLIVFNRDIYNNYETYMLATFHMFIVVVSSLLTYQRRYTIFTTALGILYLVLLYFLRAIPFQSELNPLEIDDYLVAIALLAMAGFIIASTVNRRKRLLEIANEETNQNIAKAKALKESLEEKDILLNEVHHRVKNNLNVAISLQRLQIRNLDPENEAVAALQESIGRLNSMAQVHERLYAAGNLKAVDFKPYIVAISDAVVRSFEKPNIKFIVNVEDGFSIELTRAVPCGLILNELITNICKHAYPNDEPGVAEITFTLSMDHMVTLIVSDEGVGIPDTDWNASNSLGMYLINMLTEQLAGTLSIESSAGTTVIISFPLSD